MLSTFGWCGSVNNKNLVPVTVWKQVSRKFDDSRTSIPVRCELGTPMADGVRDFVIAWTLLNGSCQRLNLFILAMPIIRMYVQALDHEYRTHEMCLRAQDNH